MIRDELTALMRDIPPSQATDRLQDFFEAMVAYRETLVAEICRMQSEIQETDQMIKYAIRHKLNMGNYPHIYEFKTLVRNGLAHEDDAP